LFGSKVSIGESVQGNLSESAESIYLAILNFANILSRRAMQSLELLVNDILRLFARFAARLPFFQITRAL
jgi:hypothetical protein